MEEERESGIGTKLGCHTTRLVRPYSPNKGVKRAFLGAR